MAYGNQSNRFSPKSPASQGNSAGAPRTNGGGMKAGLNKLLMSTGLFKPRSEKVKAVASVATEIPVDLKAGQRVFIDLHQNSPEDVAAGKPPFFILIKEAPEQKRA
jgi:hypothetical protein